MAVDQAARPVACHRVSRVDLACLCLASDELQRSLLICATAAHVCRLARRNPRRWQPSNRKGEPMLRWRSRITLLLGLVLSTSLCSAQTPAPTPKSLDDFDAIVAKAMADSKIPGISLAIVRDGKVIYAKGFGYRDVENKLPVTTDT